MGNVGKKVNKDQQLTQVEQAVKKTGRGGRENFPNAIKEESPEDIRQVLTSCLHWYKRGEESKAKTDEEVRQRTIEYFSFCLDNNIRPTVESYALALGYVRQTLNAWENGNNASATRQDIIKKAKEFLAAFDAGLVAAGKMNPVPYIFRAKNYYGMRDNQDITITPNTSGITDKSADEIVQEWESLPGD